MKKLKLTTGIISLLLVVTMSATAQQTSSKPDDSRKVTRVSVSGDSTVQAQPAIAVAGALDRQAAGGDERVVAGVEPDAHFGGRDARFQSYGV